jgi:hypothetical protein
LRLLDRVHNAAPQLPLNEGRQGALGADEIPFELLPQLHEESRDDGTRFETLQRGLAQLFDVPERRRVAVGEACGKALQHIEEGSMQRMVRFDCGLAQLD